MLRRPPPQDMMKALWSDFQAGKQPVISFKYFGFTQTLTPLYPICIEVVELYFVVFTNSSLFVVSSFCIVAGYYLVSYHTTFLNIHAVSMVLFVPQKN